MITDKERGNKIRALLNEIREHTTALRKNEVEVKFSLTGVGNTPSVVMYKDTRNFY